ncbi:unnamed protein product [Brassica oleracea]
MEMKKAVISSMGGVTWEILRMWTICLGTVIRLSAWTVLIMKMTCAGSLLLSQMLNTEDIKPDMMLGNQRTPMLQVEDFLNSIESNYGLEDENGYNIMGGLAQGNSSENVYDTSLLEKDILILVNLLPTVYQRHNCMNPNGGNRVSHLETGETDKYVGFMDIETDTNPIDRSIAHLLFHRPSDSSLSSDILSYKTHPVIPHPNSSPSLRIEKEEETREQLGTEAEGVASTQVRNKSPDSNTWLPL